MENRSKKLIKNTAILSFGTLCTRGIMFIMTPLFTRWLSQSEYGTFDLILTYITLLMPIISLNCSDATFRFLMNSRTEKRKCQIISNSIVINCIGFLIAIILAFIACLFYNNELKVIIFFVVLLILESINTMFTMILRGIKKLHIYTIANILFVVSMVIFVTLFVRILSLGLNGIILGYSLGYIVSSLFMMVVSKSYKYFSIKYVKKKLAKIMLKYSIPLIPNSISWWIMNASDRTIVSLVLGTSASAVLAIANKIPNLCQTFFNVFHLSWQENAIDTKNDKDRDKYYNKVLNNVINTLIPIACVILSFNFVFFDFIFTNEYYLAYYQVPILVLSMIVAIIAKFLGAIYIVNMETGKNGKTTVITAIINIVVHISLIKFIGLYAATISTLISYLVLFFIRYIDIRKNITLKLDKKVYESIVILMYFVIMVYINNIYINVANVLIAAIYFIVGNKKIILTVLNKIFKKN